MKAAPIPLKTRRLIRAAMAANGITSAALARRLGMSPPGLCGLLSGRPTRLAMQWAIVAAIHAGNSIAGTPERVIAQTLVHLTQFNAP